MGSCRTWLRPSQKADGTKCAGCGEVFTSPCFRRAVYGEDGDKQEYHADPFGKNCTNKIPVLVPINT